MEYMIWIGSSLILAVMLYLVYKRWRLKGFSNDLNRLVRRTLKQGNQGKIDLINCLFDDSPLILTYKGFCTEFIVVKKLMNFADEIASYTGGGRCQFSHSGGSHAKEFKFSIECANRVIPELFADHDGLVHYVLVGVRGGERHLDFERATITGCDRPRRQVPKNIKKLKVA